jgi:hypothetical protein
MINKSRIATEPTLPLPGRARLLRDAEMAICNQKAEEHGPARENLGTIASMWSTYLAAIGHRPLMAHDVALMQNLVKISRLATNPDNADSWMDQAGYAGLGYEMRFEG